MTLSIAIQSCPPRAKRAVELARVLGGQACEARVFGHHVLDPVITTDVEMRGARQGAALAWGAASNSTTHHLVVQDDAVPCADFVATVAALVALHPADPISLCSLAPRGPGPVPSLRRTRRVLGAQAIVMPTELARTVAKYLARGDQTLDDEAIAHVLDALRVRLLVTAPALAQHDVSTPSLVGHDAVLDELVARDFIGPRSEARFLPWRDAPVIPEVF